MSGCPADNPAYRRIVAQALGVVHVLISSKAAEHCYAPTTETRCDGSDMPFAQNDEGVAILDYALNNRPSTGVWAAG